MSTLPRLYASGRRCDFCAKDELPGRTSGNVQEKHGHDCHEADQDQ